MPGYPFLEKTPLNYDNMADRMRTLQRIGVPYSDEMIASAKTDVLAQISPDTSAAKALMQRYPKAQVRRFDGQPGDDVPPSELDAVVAYLQMLGTLVDFTKFDASGPNLR